jgi:hypothetical protein
MTSVGEMTWACDEGGVSRGSHTAEVIILISLSVLVSAIWPVNLQDESHSSHYAKVILLRWPQRLVTDEPLGPSAPASRRHSHADECVPASWPGPGSLSPRSVPRGHHQPDSFSH